MKFYKYKSSLYFEEDSDNILRYDFKDNGFYKITNGRKERKISNPQAFFRGMNFYEVFDSCEDKKYQEYIDRVRKIKYRCSNIGTFLCYLKDYQNLEQWILLGIRIDGRITLKVSDVPKDILKIIKDNDMVIRNYDEYYYKSDNFINGFRYVYNDRGIEDLKRFINFYSEDYNTLINIYSYEYKRLIDYIFYLYDFENYGYYTTNHLRDYVLMQSSMNLKFNKYPKYLKSVHDITVANYNVFKETHDQELFIKNINKELCHTGREFSMVVPEKTDDVKDEGVMLHHCVASYIKRIINGTTQIVFLRNNKDLKKSLVTVEVRNNKIIQASGEYNRSLKEKELTFLERYCIVKKIEMNKGLCR